MSAARKFESKEKRRYTYADYCTWDDDERWELIDGVPYAMAAPSIAHQGVSGNIYLQIGQFLRKRPCRVFYAPTDVRLYADTKDDTVVQPDLLVVCDNSKLDGKGVIGAPDMVVEVLSPSTASYDMIKKFMLYSRAKVREYWIVDPASETVVVNLLEGDNYAAKAYEKPEVVPVSVLEGCSVDLAEVFLETEDLE